MHAINLLYRSSTPTTELHFKKVYYRGDKLSVPGRLPAIMTDNNNPYDIFSPASQRNPHLHDSMRQNDPVHAAIHPQTGQTHWFLTRYDDCLAFLKDKRFGKEFRRRLPSHITEKWSIDSTEDSINLNMLNLDEPAHTRLKSLVHLAFMPQRINQLRPRLQKLADSLFDVIDKSVADGDEFDLTQYYISKLPLMSIIEMLGLPMTDFEQLFVWTHGMLSQDDSIVRPAIANLSHYLDERIDNRRNNPDMPDDVLSALILAEDAGDKLSQEELLSMVVLLITAGYETMVNFISNSVMTLFEFPAQMQLLKKNLDNPAVVQSAIEELLRYSGPSHITLASWAFEDVGMGDKVIRQGDIVHAVLFAANRDPLIFDDPQRFDIMRTPNKHIAFSYGIHHCLGAALARLQGDIAITTLLRRIPTM